MLNGGVGLGEGLSRPLQGYLENMIRQVHCIQFVKKLSKLEILGVSQKALHAVIYDQLVQTGSQEI